MTPRVHCRRRDIDRIGAVRAGTAPSRRSRRDTPEVGDDGFIRRTIERASASSDATGFPQKSSWTRATQRQAHLGDDDAAFASGWAFPSPGARKRARQKITDETDFARAALLRFLNEDGQASIPFWSPEEVEAALRPALSTSKRSRPRYPTETVYGFGGGIDRDSVDALVKLKHRPPGKAFLLLIAGPDMIDRPDAFAKLCGESRGETRPGPLTLVLSGGEGECRAGCGGLRAELPCDGRATADFAFDSRPRRRDYLHERQPSGARRQHRPEILSQWGDAARGILRADGGRLAPSQLSTVPDCTDGCARDPPRSDLGKLAARERSKSDGDA